ncbi:MAG: MarR family transcriptional regulator [Burkholderiales bacterium]|nr:MarR family transcriptional regulator [Burkholderiales bacterium]
MFDECLYFNTTLLARQLDREWTVAFKPFDLTPPQGFMLRAVLRNPGLLQHELADRLDIARPTATRAIDGLVKKGLIERRSTEADKRECAIYATPDAEAMQAALDAASGSVTARLKQLLGDGHFRDVVKQVKGVHAALK